MSLANSRLRHALIFVSSEALPADTPFRRVTRWTPTRPASSPAPHEGPVPGRIGEAVTERLDHIGIVKGQIDRTTRAGFYVALNADAEEQRGLAARIRWLKLRHVGRASNRRHDQRHKPRNPKSQLYVGDAEHDCFIIDLSSAGAAASASIRPAVGAICT